MPANSTDKLLFSVQSPLAPNQTHHAGGFLPIVRTRRAVRKKKWGVLTLEVVQWLENQTHDTHHVVWNLELAQRQTPVAHHCLKVNVIFI